MLDALFRPKSVAVIGASSKELHIGNRVIRNLIDFGFKGEIYPVNPKSDQINGLKAYKSLLDIPVEQIDVVHMVIPAKFVPLAFEDCAKKGVKNVIINSGGFSEIGPKGEAIQKDFLDKARKYGIRVFGPNCQGIINTDQEVRAYCNFTFTKPDAGGISIAALSGGVAELIHQAFAQMGIGTRIYASNGNACDITIPEIVDYLSEDKETKTIILYVEGLRDAAAFMNAAKQAAAIKPVLAMKAGRTETGAKAASSHTGGLAKIDLATELIFKKAGVLSFRDEAELCRAAVAFASQPIPRGNRVGMITNTGGPAVIATDVLTDAGLEMPQLSEKAISILKEKLFPEASVANPADLLATGTAEHFRTAIDVMLDEDNIDSIFINFVTPFFVDTDSIAREIVDAGTQKRKPIICNLMTDPNQWTQTVKILKEGGIPCFAFPSDAAKVLCAMVRYNQLHTRNIGKVTEFAGIDKKSAEDILSKAKQKSVLPAEDVYKILEAYGIPAADRKIADGADEAAKAAQQIGFPVVVKADSQTIIHKSDMGAVAVNLADQDAVKAVALEMSKKFAAQDLKFFIQKYIPADKEIILGAKKEPGIGHLIMFGLGGIYVEVLKDVVFNLSPVTRFEAQEMISSIKTSALLTGTRGQKGVNIQRIEEIIQRVSRLVTDLPDIEEMDLNPLVAYEEEVVAVDARIIKC